jgi:hypothetical protein
MDLRQSVRRNRQFLLSPTVASGPVVVFFCCLRYFHGDRLLDGDRFFYCCRHSSLLRLFIHNHFVYCCRLSSIHHLFTCNRPVYCYRLFSLLRILIHNRPVYCCRLSSLRRLFVHNRLVSVTSFLVSFVLSFTTILFTVTRFLASSIFSFTTVLFLVVGFPAFFVFLAAVVPWAMLMFLSSTVTDYSQIDRYLFGHPSLQRFRSPNEFWPHFTYLMNNRSTPCTCRLCTPKARKAAPRAMSLGSAFAEESSILEEHLKQLSLREGQLHMPIDEATAPKTLFKLGTSQEVIAQFNGMPSYLPRRGEIVAFCLEREEASIIFDADNQCFVVSGPEQRMPHWMAGAVIEVPDPLPLIEDGTTSGSFYVLRTITHPVQRQGMVPTDHRVPLHHIRSLSCLPQVLSGIECRDWDTTILSAMKHMAGCAPFVPYDFHGNNIDGELEASVSCRGIWLGAELIVAGKRISLKGRFQSNLTDRS